MSENEQQRIRTAFEIPDDAPVQFYRAWRVTYMRACNCKSLELLIRWTWITLSVETCPVCLPVPGNAQDHWSGIRDAEQTVLDI